MAVAQRAALTGLKLAYNTFVVLDDQASLTPPWWRRIGPHADYLTAEGWMYPNGNLRKAGSSEWWQFWDQHRALHPLCQSMNVGFLPVDEHGGALVRDYTLCTFLLDFNGLGANIWMESATGTADRGAPRTRRQRRLVHLRGQRSRVGTCGHGSSRAARSRLTQGRGQRASHERRRAVQPRTDLPVR